MHLINDNSHDSIRDLDIEVITDKKKVSEEENVVRTKTIYQMFGAIVCFGNKYSGEGNLQPWTKFLEQKKSSNIEQGKKIFVFAYTFC